MVRVIQERAQSKFNKNNEQAQKVVNYSLGLFMKVYRQLSKLANVTSDSIHIYLKLFSITDANQRRLVRSKMSNIFKPNIRRALNQGRTTGMARYGHGHTNNFAQLTAGVSRKVSAC